MADVLNVVPQLTAVLEHRKASSGCCGAKLNPGAEPGTFTCRSCAQPCERVMSDPVIITAHSTGTEAPAPSRSGLLAVLARFFPSRPRRTVPPGSGEEASHG